MAVLKRIANKHGNGAGRAPYALEKAVAVRTDIPSSLSLLLGSGELPSELKRELAREFNRHLLIHQGNCKTQHFVISLGHHLTQRQIEKLLDRIEAIFSDPFRYHLYAVHQEDHGTAVHIIESADPDGKLRHLSQKEFYDLKRTVIRELRPFMNAREREVARNFQKSTPTQDWKHQVELHAPERSFKEYVRQAVLKASELIKQGDVEEAVEFLTSKGIEITEKKAGELSPFGRILKRDRMYAVVNHPKYGLVAVRLDKKMRATFRLYLNALEELDRELREAEEAIREGQEAYRGAPGAGKQKPADRGGAPEERSRAPGSHLVLRPAPERSQPPKEPETKTSGAGTGVPGPAERTGRPDRQAQISEGPVLNRGRYLKERNKNLETGEREPLKTGAQPSAAEKVSEEQEGIPSLVPSPYREPHGKRAPIQDREKLQKEAPEPEAEPYRGAETAELLSSKRPDAGSSEDLGNIHRQPKQPLLPSHSPDLSGSLQHKRQVEVPDKPLRNVYTSKSQSEIIPRELIDQIKQLPPERILSFLGIPYKRSGNQIMAHAVWRGDKRASVSIQYRDGKWLWHDHGTGEGGDWIDLYRRYTGSDFKEAVHTLMEFTKFAYTPNISTREAVLYDGKKQKSSSDFEEIESISLAELPELPEDLRDYLEQKGFLSHLEKLRKIPELHYLRYRRGNREYSGLAVKTLSGNWVIKNRHGTYVSESPGGITLWQRDPSKVIVVESFTDAMALSIYGKFGDHTMLILNGLGNLNRALEVLKMLSPKKLYIAIDLDGRGIEARRKLKKAFPEALQVYFYGKDPAEHLKYDGAFPPASEDGLSSIGDMQVIENFILGGSLTKYLMSEFSPELYELYLDYLILEEDSKLAEEEINIEKEPDRDWDDDWNYGPEM